MPTYFSRVTTAGQAKIAEAVSGGDAIDITHLAVGDGDGLPTTPTVGATALVNEVWRGSVTSAVRDPENPTQVVVTATIPLGAGPFSIREAAILTGDGELFAIANYPETYKTAPSEGTASEIVVEFVVVIDTAASVAITISPSSMIAAHLLLRQPFIAVDSMTVAAPPGAPVLGALHVVPPAATGAWVGHTHHLAQWTGSEWVFADAVERTVVGVIDQGLYYRRTSTGWVVFSATETASGLVRLASAADIAARDATSALTPSSLPDIAAYSPIYPEILTADNKAALTSSTAEVVVSAGTAFIHRGINRYSTDGFSAPARTFATAASKTYHLRWYAPGHTLAPKVSYPVGRLMLRDLADGAYNTGAAAETSSVFDTTYDDMLIARVVTNSGNTPTVTALVNKDRLFASANVGVFLSRLSDSNGFVTANPAVTTLNWARTPKVSGNIAFYSYPGTLSNVQEQPIVLYSGSYTDGSGTNTGSLTRYAVTPVLYWESNNASIYIDGSYLYNAWMQA